jgi:hypothetical protein
MVVFCFSVWYNTFKGVMIMSPQVQIKRQNAVMVADALNKIEGVPVTDFARELSAKWAKGEITGIEMKKALIAAHKKVS